MECVGFHIDCGTLAKGVGVVAMALTLFVEACSSS